MSSPHNEFIRSAAKMENALATALRTVTKRGNTKEIGDFIKLITKKELVLDFLLEQVLKEQPCLDSNSLNGMSPVKNSDTIAPARILDKPTATIKQENCRCPIMLDLVDVRGADVLVTPPDQDRPYCYSGQIHLKAKNYSYECLNCNPEDHYLEIHFHEEFGGHSLILKQAPKHSFISNEHSDMTVFEGIVHASGNMVMEQTFKIVIILENHESNRFMNITINCTGMEDGTLISTTFDAKKIAIRME